MSEAITDPPRALSPVPGYGPQALPSLGDLGLREDGCTERQSGGRQAGLDLIDSFLAGRAQNYRREMSNPLAGARSCSRLSPHLARGTVSIREVTQATWTRLRDLKEETDPAAKKLRASLISFSGVARQSG